MVQFVSENPIISWKSALGEQVHSLPVHDPRSGPGAILEKMSGAALQLARNPMESQFFEERIGVRHAAAS